MRAVIIMYEGVEIPDHVMNTMIAKMHVINPEQVTVMSLTNKEVAEALIKTVVKPTAVPVEPAAQESIDAAVDYITEKVLTRFNSPATVAYAIGRHISCGDDEMRTAVEILATKKGLIKEPKLTKPILNTIKSIYTGMKELG